MSINKNEQYDNILTSIEALRKDVIDRHTSDLMLTGAIPASAQKEILALNTLKGHTFRCVIDSGISTTQNPNNDELVDLTLINTHSCLKSVIPGEVKAIAPIETSTKVEVKKEEPVISKPEVVEEKVSEPTPVVPIPIPVPTPVDISPSMDDEEITDEPIEDTPINDTKVEDIPPIPPIVTNTNNEDDEIIDDEPIEDNEPIEEEIVDDTPIVDTPIDDTPIVESKTEEPYSPVSSMFDEALGKLEDEPIEDAPIEENGPSLEDMVSNISSEPAPVQATVIGGNAPTSVNSMNLADMFIEEKSKLGSEFIYNYSKISVMHTDLGGRPEEMLVMIAPLKIYKYAIASVPIVVTIYHKGTQVTASSYDSKDTGKNIVTVDIDEFYFLCRGSFDDNGQFKATVVTTGISANQGDKISVISSKTYGNATSREARNGHVKFSYQAESGPGTIEIIPFGEIGDDDFVAIVQNSEFVDYYLISQQLRVNQRPIVYGANGLTQELICHWSGDTLEVELM